MRATPDVPLNGGGQGPAGERTPAERAAGRRRIRTATVVGLAAGAVAFGVAWSAAQPSEQLPDRSWVTWAEIEDYTDLPDPDDRLRDVVTGWAVSPLYVDPAVAHMLPDGDRAAVAAALEEGPPTFVAIMPFVSQDGMGGNAEAAALVLAAAFGDDGEYVIIDQDRQVAAVRQYGGVVAFGGVVVGRRGELSDELLRTFHGGRSLWIPGET